MISSGECVSAKGVKLRMSGVQTYGSLLFLRLTLLADKRCKTSRKPAGQTTLHIALGPLQVVRHIYSFLPAEQHTRAPCRLTQTTQRKIETVFRQKER